MYCDCYLNFWFYDWKNPFSQTYILFKNDSMPNGRKAIGLQIPSTLPARQCPQLELMLSLTTLWVLVGQSCPRVVNFESTFLGHKRSKSQVSPNPLHNSRYELSNSIWKSKKGLWDQKLNQIKDNLWKLRNQGWKDQYKGKSHIVGPWENQNPVVLQSPNPTSRIITVSHIGLLCISTGPRSS